MQVLVSSAAPTSGLTPFSPPPRRRSGDEVRLGERPPAELPRPDRSEEKGPQVTPHSGWVRGVCLVLAGTLGAVALTGCTRQQPPISQTTEHSQAEKALGQAFDEADQLLARQGSKEDATRRVMSAIGDYARTTGRSAQQVASDLKGFMIQHPVLTLSVAYSAGVATGIGLEKLGLSDAAGTSVETIRQAIKDHPIMTGVVVVAATAAVGYLVYQALETQQAPVAPVPDTPEARQLQGEFDTLEKQVNASQGGDTRAQAAQVSASLQAKIAEYARATGRSVEQVGGELRQFYIDHPGVSAAVVMSAGVGTGVLLERAGVPATVAAAAQTALASTGHGLAGVEKAIQEHPVLSTAVGVAIAAGAVYAVHQAAQ